MAFVFGGSFVPYSSADPPPDPPPLPDGGHGSGSNQPPAGAPIDDGMIILIVLGTAFAAVTLNKNRVRCREVK